MKKCAVKDLNIKGLKFREDLEGRNFEGRQAGIQRYWAISVSLIALLLLITSGVFLSTGCYFSLFLLQSDSDLYYGFYVIFLLLVSIILTLKKGLFLGVFLGIGGLVPFGILDAVVGGNDTAGFIIAFFVGSSAIFLTLFGIAICASSMALKIIRFFSLSTGIFISVIICELIFASQYSSYKFKSQLLVYVGFAFIFITSTLGGLIAKQAMEVKYDISVKFEFQWIEQAVILINSLQGTSFYKLSLERANFENAILEYTDFRKANLTHTRFSKARGLDRARLANTYLANPKIRQLVVTCNGQGHNFDGLDLTGVNLQDAHLQDASFMGASLNQSNLRGADLSRAILKQTQLEGADLTGAILTGAYIEDWGITSTTKLENVQCEYVYMRVPTKENPNPLRKPDNLRETFAEGEFADFIQPFFDTLDLYHSQDVDPRAISIALKNLSVNHPGDDLQFVAIERRGNNGLNLRFTTVPGANKSELSHEYFSSYAQIKKELPIAAQMKLAEQDAEIRTLKGTIEQFIQTGTHQYSIQAEIAQLIQGGESVVTENRGISINAGDNANVSGLSSGDGVMNLGTISGNVTNAINQLSNLSESEQPDLKTLLTQLQQAIQTDTDLLKPDKSDLLEQVQALAEAKQTEEPTKREGITRKAMKMFDATLKSLPETAKIAEACSKLLPLILRALGLPA